MSPKGPVRSTPRKMNALSTDLAERVCYTEIRNPRAKGGAPALRIV